MTLGAIPQAGSRCCFRVWAPRARSARVHLLEATERVVAMEHEGRGYWTALVDDVPEGALYAYRLDGGPDRPDPASRRQPSGVHGPSAVTSLAFAWNDDRWRTPALADFIGYELHVGTFSGAGTFDGVVAHLDELARLGVNAVEFMPVAPFAGRRNWGYDGVAPFAVHEGYGGPHGFQRLVDACHARGLAVVLDVVYNHLGPEGNYLAEFGPYFTDAYRTPWGPAINFDGSGSDEVREYFIQNALQWFDDYRVDALRLDAVHAIIDRSPDPFLAELARRCHGHGLLIVESDANDRRLVTAPEAGGWGLDGVWNDDFHHALHALLTGESQGYYADFGGVAAVEKAYRSGFVYTGERSRYRGRRHGSPSDDIAPERFVVFAQNHDQVGNRAGGERLSALVSRDALRLAAGAVLLAPYVPLLFMGEEYGETAPFLYFTSHGDPRLGEAVRKGRRRESAAFGWRGEIPDPQAEETFARSRLTRRRDESLAAWYAELIRLRRGVPTLARPTRDGLRVTRTGPVVVVERGECAVAMNFGGEPAGAVLPAGPWRRLADSTDERWGGPGASVPERLDADGRSAWTMSPLALALLQRG